MIMSCIISVVYYNNYKRAFEDFENLPNLHVNLSFSATRKKYATFLNTVRHLFDGGIDKRFSSTNNALMNLPYHLKRLIVEKPFDPEEDISDDEYISNIIKEGIPKKHAEENVPNDSGFCRELASVYQKMGYEVAFFESSCRYYELICFSVEDNGIHNIVCIHERNNRRFAFIGHKSEHPVWGFGHKVLDKLPGIAHSYFIDKFEITNQKKLECPVYRLRDTRRIRPISELDINNTAHFIHHCNDDECISGRLSRFWE
ncbi:hypothetical protein RhiirA4_457283 [Rhizophagus irregularis]|uniref:Uncharacterized protein n=1 Tax=Rhizophagus irregularis TaxID=588596 RepID=A0A2I1G9L1_9GLOM|nr:hypothetical protein RhiirA4_457283 [Rhizophagus irregularis]